jgi:hypothetical protein
MTDLEKEFVDKINAERKEEIKYNEKKIGIDYTMRDMKILYDSAIENGFNEYQAMVYTNTYMSSIINYNMNNQENNTMG